MSTCGAGDVPIGFTPDDRALWVYRRGRVSVTIDRAEIEGTSRTTLHTIRPADPAGILDIFPVPSAVRFRVRLNADELGSVRRLFREHAREKNPSRI